MNDNDCVLKENIKYDKNEFKKKKIIMWSNVNS